MRIVENTSFVLTGLIVISALVVQGDLFSPAGQSPGWLQDKETRGAEHGQGAVKGVLAFVQMQRQGFNTKSRTNGL